MTDYTPSGDPLTGSRGISSLIRSELTAVATAISSKQNSNALSTVSITPTLIPVSAPSTISMVWEIGKSFLPGYYVTIVDRANPATKNMFGMVLSYNIVSGAVSLNITSYTGSGTLSDWIIVTTSQAGVTLGSNTFTGFQNFSRATVASAATTSDIWNALGNQIDFTGTATVTGFPAAPQAGAQRVLICDGACVFTAGANLLINGVASGSSVTCAANDKIIVDAITTTQFSITRLRYDGIQAKTSGDHEVYLESANGLGAVNTAIRRYTTVKRNVGTAITYADSANNGASFTINETRWYDVQMMDYRAAGVSQFGISVNSAQLTTAIVAGGFTSATRLAVGSSAAAGVAGFMAAKVKLTSGDILRPHTDGVVDGTGALTWFRISASDYSL